MTKEQEKAIYRLNLGKNIPISSECCIVNVKDIETVLSMLEEQEYRIKQLGKGQQTLIQSRRKWKHRYYKMKNKIEEQDEELQMLKDFEEIADSKVTDLNPIRASKSKSIAK